MTIMQTEPRWLYVVGKPHELLEAEAYYSVMTNAPKTCLTLNRLQKADGRT